MIRLYNFRIDSPKIVTGFERIRDQPNEHQKLPSKKSLTAKTNFNTFLIVVLFVNDSALLNSI